MRAYEHAHWDARFERLHANESPWPPSIGSEGERLALHRYPEPQPPALIEALARAFGVSSGDLLVTRGSDEGIDLLTRTFCEAGRDAVVVCPPTFGMYAVAAATQGAQILEAPLTNEFELDIVSIKAKVDEGAKILWICSPNNPTGNAFASVRIESLLDYARYRCIVVIDEAYAEFSTAPSAISLRQRYPQLVVLKSLSKAYGLAGARIGAVIAEPSVIALLRKIVPPYSISSASIDEAIRVLHEGSRTVIASRVETIVKERDRVAAQLASSPLIKKIHRSDSNFLLIESTAAASMLACLRDIGILVRDFSGRGTLGQAVRITIGTPEQNDRIIEALCSTFSGRALQ